MGMDQEGGFTQPPPIEQSPKKTFPQIYQNMKAYKILIITGIALIVLGGTICAVSGITFRPNQTTDYGDDDDYYYDDDYGDDDYNEQMQEKEEVTTFTYMIGATSLQIGLLLVVVVVGTIVANDNFPTGLRITAGIMTLLLCNLLAAVFILAGPARLLSLGGF